MQENIWLWVGFITFVLAMLAIDLGVFNRKAHAPSVREASAWTAVWISLAVVFNVLVYAFWGRVMVGSELSNSTAALQFLTGYLIEYSLSVDNIFVFVLLF